jgi:hypothetical protein
MGPDEGKGLKLKPERGVRSEITVAQPRIMRL